MPSDTTTITVPTALVEAVREASRDRVPPWPEHRRYGMCAAQTEALAGMLDAILAAPPAPAQPDLDALEAAMRDATPALDTMREMAESVGYGYWHPDSPHDFSPDEQSCTADEIAAHKAACEAYDQGARVAPPPVHDIGRDDAGRVVVSLLTPAWGIGSYVMRDDAMGAARSVVLAVGPLVAEVRRLRAVRDAAEAYERAMHAANVVDYDAGDEWQLRRQAVRDGIDTLRAAIDAAQGVPRG